jgi:hypothetical protein
MEGHEAFCRKLREGIRTLNIWNVGKIDALKRMLHVVESDGVHLTLSFGKVFLNALLLNVDWYFNAEVVDIEA